MHKEAKDSVGESIARVCLLVDIGRAGLGGSRAGVGVGEEGE